MPLLPPGGGVPAGLPGPSDPLAGGGFSTLVRLDKTREMIYKEDHLLNGLLGPYGSDASTAILDGWGWNGTSMVDTTTGGWLGGAGGPSQVWWMLFAGPLGRQRRPMARPICSSATAPTGPRADGWPGRPVLQRGHDWPRQEQGAAWPATCVRRLPAHGQEAERVLTKLVPHAGRWTIDGLTPPARCSALCWHQAKCLNGRRRPGRRSANWSGAGDSVSAAGDLVAGLVIGSRLRDAGVRLTASD